MRRIFCIILSLFILTACGVNEANTDISETEPYSQEHFSESESEFIGVWIPIYEAVPDSDTDYDGYASEISEMFKKISDFNITDIFVQVRANCDSIYYSEYFSPHIKYCNSYELKFDALEIMVREAHKNSLNIHAWINPYRVSGTGEYKTDNIIFNYITTDDLIVGESFVYIKPSSVKGRKLVLDGIREIVENYDVDGIHIDDYFYPATDESIDISDYGDYVSQGGMLSLSDWRRENVNILVSSIYSVVKNHNEKLIFSISPCGDVDKNFDNYYADVETWCRCEGFADMIIPQIYYGFENSTQPFENCLNKWISIVDETKVKLAVGLAVYKAGEEDRYAGDGKYEWIENEDVIKRQVECVRKNNLDGIAFFSYNYIFGNSYFKNNEIINLKEVL